MLITAAQRANRDPLEALGFTGPLTEAVAEWYLQFVDEKYREFVATEKAKQEAERTVGVRNAWHDATRGKKGYRGPRGHLKGEW